MSELKYTEIEAEFKTHEKICAERYEGILDSFDKGSKRMQRIEYLLYAVIASVFFGKDMILDIVKTFIDK